MQDRRCDFPRPFGTTAQNAVNFCGVLHQALHFPRNRRQFRHRQIRQQRFEFRELLAAHFGQNGIHRLIRQCGIDVHQIAGVGAFFQPFGRFGQGFGIGFGLADFFRNGVCIVGHVDAAGIGRVRFRHLLGAIAQGHDPRGRAFDHGVGHGKEIHAVVMIEFRGNVAGQFDMLFLIFAHRHFGRVIQQNIRRHQRRIREQPKRGILSVFPSLVLPLGHALHPAHPRHGVENPRQLGVFCDLALVEQDGFFRVDAAGNKACRQFAGLFAQGFGVLPDGDRVHVDNAVNGFDPVCLLIGKALQRAQIIAKGQPARGLDARKHPRFKSGVRVGLRLDRIRHVIISVWIYWCGWLTHAPKPRQGKPDEQSK